MSWIAALDGATQFEAVLQQRPELLRRFRTFYATLWTAGGLPVRVLELCRLRIAAIHDCEAEWAIRDARVALDPAILAALRQGRCEDCAADEQAALAVAEQLPYAHHAITDADVERLNAAFGASGTVALLTALAFFDVICRLKIVFEIEPEPVVLPAPPLRDGSLA
jgi:alkylhydroperoxidase family enzyme